MIQGRVRTDWVWVMLAYLTLFVFGLADNVRGPLFPEILQDFQVTHSKGSLFFVVASATSILGAYIVPTLLRITTYAKVLGLFLVFMTIALLGFYSVKQFEILLFFCFLFGLGIGGLGVVQNLLVLLAARDERRQQLQSGLHACYGAASWLAPGFIILVANAERSWRVNFLLIGMMFVGSLVFLLVFARRGEDLKLPVENKESPTYLRSQAWYLALSLAVYVALEILMSSRLALFLRSEEGLDLAQSSFWMSWYFAGLLGGRVVLIFYRPPFAIRNQMLVSLLGTGAVMVLGLLHHPAWMVASGLTMAPFFPLMMTAMSLLFPSHVEKVAALGISVSGVVVVGMHAAFGVISDVWGLRTAFWFGLLLPAAAILLLLGFNKTFQRSIP